MKLVLHLAQIICCGVVLFVMNLTSVCNWAGVFSMVLLDYILDIYLLSSELVYPNLIFVLSAIILMKGFAECKIHQGTYIIIAETHTWAIHTRKSRTQLKTGMDVHLSCNQQPQEGGGSGDSLAQSKVGVYQHLICDLKKVVSFLEA